MPISVSVPAPPLGAKPRDRLTTCAASSLSGTAGAELRAPTNTGGDS